MTTLKYKERTRKAQTYDKDNIFIEMRGEKINIYDYIQTGREDTEIMPTLLKYGSIERLGLDTKKTYDTMIEINDLRDIYQAKERADKLWESLPVEVRAEFNHNPEEFMNKGESWLKAKIEKETIPDLSQATAATIENKGVENG